MSPEQVDVHKSRMVRLKTLVAELAAEFVEELHAVSDRVAALEAEVLHLKAASREPVQDPCPPAAEDAEPEPLRIYRGAD